jgi:hypothetical protein
MDFSKILDFVKKYKKSLIAVVASILLIFGFITSKQFDEVVNVNDEKFEEIVKESVISDEPTTDTLKTNVKEND